MYAPITVPWPGGLGRGMDAFKSQSHPLSIKSLVTGADLASSLGGVITGESGGYGIPLRQGGGTRRPPLEKFVYLHNYLKRGFYEDIK